MKEGRLGGCKADGTDGTSETDVSNARRETRDFQLFIHFTLSPISLISHVFLTLCSRQAVGERPVSAAKVRDRYSIDEKPERRATSFIGREVEARSRFASSIRAATISR